MRNAGATMFNYNYYVFDCTSKFFIFKIMVFFKFSFSVNDLRVRHNPSINTFSSILKQLSFIRDLKKKILIKPVTKKER